MLIKCECCGEYGWVCENNTREDDLCCKDFEPDVDKVKEYAARNDISVSETIELIKLCCR